MTHLEMHKLENLAADSILNSIPGIDRGMALGAAQALLDVVEVAYSIEVRHRLKEGPDTGPLPYGAALDKLTEAMGGLIKDIREVAGFGGGNGEVQK